MFFELGLGLSKQVSILLPDHSQLLSRHGTECDVCGCPRRDASLVLVDVVLGGAAGSRALTTRGSSHNARVTMFWLETTCRQGSILLQSVNTTRIFSTTPR